LHNFNRNYNHNIDSTNYKMGPSIIHLSWDSTFFISLGHMLQFQITHTWNITRVWPRRLDVRGQTAR